MRSQEEAGGRARGFRTRLVGCDGAEIGGEVVEEAETLRQEWERSAVGRSRWASGLWISVRLLTSSGIGKVHGGHRNQGSAGV